MLAVDSSLWDEKTEYAEVANVCEVECYNESKVDAVQARKRRGEYWKLTSLYDRE